MAQQLSEAQLFDCCACRTFAARVAARLAAGDRLEAVVAAARYVWWHEVRRGCSNPATSSLTVLSPLLSRQICRGVGLSSVTLIVFDGHLTILSLIVGFPQASNGAQLQAEACNGARCVDAQDRDHGGATILIRAVSLKPGDLADADQRLQQLHEARCPAVSL